MEGGRYPGSLTFFWYDLIDIGGPCFLITLKVKQHYTPSQGFFLLWNGTTSCITYSSMIIVHAFTTLKRMLLGSVDDTEPFRIALTQKHTLFFTIPRS